MTGPDRLFAWRDDPAVPPFDDETPLFVFDGVCVLCSGGAAWIMRNDRAGRVNFTSAQGTLGSALYAHIGLPMDDSYLFVHRGRILTRTAGYLELCRVLGGWWRLCRVAAIIPEGWRDAAYDLVARNRYRWFGKADYCALLSAEQRRRLL